MTSKYSDTEYDAAFARTLNSSRSYVTTRVLMLAVVFWLLARGIVKYELSGSLLLVPIAFEFLLVLWLGLLMSKTLITCPAFVGAAGRTTRVVIMTLIVLGIGSTMLAVQDGSFELARVLPGWQWAWQRMAQTGLVWALVAEFVWLVIATVPEVARWRKTRGRFFWTASFDTSLRMAAVFFLMIIGLFVGIWLAEFVSIWLDTPRGQAWVVYALLICVEVGALAISVFVHRDVTR